MAKSMAPTYPNQPELHVLEEGGRMGPFWATRHLHIHGSVTQPLPHLSKGIPDLFLQQQRTF